MGNSFVSNLVTEELPNKLNRVYEWGSNNKLPASILAASLLTSLYGLTRKSSPNYTTLNRVVDPIAVGILPSLLLNQIGQFDTRNTGATWGTPLSNYSASDAIRTGVGLGSLGLSLRDILSK